MIKFEPFKFEDLEQMCNESVDMEAINHMPVWKKHRELITKIGVSKSGYLDGLLVCVAGMIFTKKDEVELWAIFSRKLTARKKTLLRSLKTILFDFILPVNGIKKVTILSRKGFGQSQTLLKHLGFSQCGLVRQRYYLYEKLI